MPKKPIGAGKSSFELIDADAFLKAINLEPEATVVDLACGAGNYTLAIARSKGAPRRIIAVDLWPEGIEALRKSANAEPVACIESHVADIRGRLPVEDTCADICLMATVLHDLVHEGDSQSTLNEVARILKPDGVLAIAEFKKLDGPPGPPKDIRLRLEDVSALLMKFGFIRFSAVVELGPHIYFAQFRKLSANR